MEEIRAQRASKHPRGLPCAGSFFKNLPPPEGESQRVPAGKLLEMAGAKGMRVGGAAVFRGHANFIVNLGGATAAEVLELAARIRSAVKREFGVELEEEVMLIDPEYSPPEESLPTYSIL
jgi:UDP-N-acetylmuramate dehydrogenase